MNQREETYFIWINPTAGILSFHFEKGFEQLCFPSAEQQMTFARTMSRRGYRIQ
jgi:hypothetical protein